MEDTKYIVVDESDSYHTSVYKFRTSEEMLEEIQNRDLSYIEVYEIAKKVKLEKRPAIVMDE